MSLGLKNTPAPDNKLANISEELVSTNQETVPVPYLAGCYPMRVTWISEALNVTIKDVQAQTGKKSTSTVAREYYANIAGALCHGALDYITQIKVDQNKVWSGLLQRDGSGTGAIYKDISVEGYGSLRIYWGTDAQTPDPLLTAAITNPDYQQTYDEMTGLFDDNGEPPTLSGNGHPAYRWIAYVVWNQLFFGRDRTSAPQVEIIGGRAPAEYSTSETDEGVNPLSIAYELITSKLYGLGRDAAAIIDATSWNATKTGISPSNPDNADKPSYHISVYLTRQQPIRTIFDDLMGYYDGFMRLVDGKLEAGYFPHRAPASEVGLLILDPSDFTDEPDIQSVGWADTYNIFQLTQVDRARSFKEAGNPYVSKHNIVITKENRPTNVSRPWITTMANGAKWIADYGKMESFPYLKGKLSCRKIRTNTLREGDLFRLNYAPHAINQLCRCLSVTEPDPGQLSRIVEFISERGVMPDPYAPAADDTPAPPRLPATALSFAKVFELPLAFFESVYTYVGIIPVRPTLATLGWRAFYTLDDPGASTPDYDEIANHLFFGALARLDVAYADSGEAAMTVTLNGVDSAMLISMTDQQQDDDRLLLVIDNEIFSVGTVTPLGGMQFSVAVKRSRRGSSMAAHVQYSLCYIIERQKMKAVTNENFLESTPGWFKLIAYTGREEADDGPIVRVDFRDRIGTPPSITIGSLPSSPTTGKTYSLTGNISDVDGDLAKYQITAAKIVSSVVDSELSLLIGEIGPDQSGSSFDFKIPFSFPSVGTWRIIVRAYDAQGGFTKVSSSDMTVNLGDFSPDDGVTPDPVSNVTITPGLTMLILEWDNPTNTTIGAIRIYESTTTTRPGLPTFVFDDSGRTFFFRENLPSSATRYYWFEVQGLNGRLSTIVGPYSNTTRAGIDLSDVVPGMTMVEIVATLPTTGNFEGRTVFLTTDRKLYRYDTTVPGFIKSVDTGDLNGQITQTQITDGSISTSKLVANAITTEKIAADAITAGLIAAGAITAAAVGTNEIIANTANIKDGIITSAKIASLVAEKITAGTLTAMVLAAAKTASDSVVYNPAYGTGSTMPAFCALSGEETGASHNINGTEYVVLITVNGWAVSSGFDADKFAKSTMVFVGNFYGAFNITDLGSGLSHADIYGVYRINGGSWVRMTQPDRATPTDGGCQTGGAVEITGLAGTDVIEFGIEIVTPASQNYGLSSMALSWGNL